MRASASVMVVFVLASFACGGPSTTPSPSPSCRQDGEACSATTDCCDPQSTCNANICSVPVACRTLGGRCLKSTDCCPGLLCDALRECSNPPHGCTRNSDCPSGQYCVSSTCTTATCSASKPCSGGRSYWGCATGTSTFYVTSDGTIFTCATPSNCNSAANQVVAWCGTPSTCTVNVGGNCTSQAQCCPQGSDPTYCTTDNGVSVCRAGCSVNSNCTSGCCAARTDGIKVCSTANHCSSCSTLGQSCSTRADCCSNLTCPRYGTACANGGMGDPCSSDLQCINKGLLCYSGVTANDGATGSSWCSTACNSDAVCGQTNACLQDTQAHYRCFPICSSNSDCVVFGPGIFCSPGTTIGGLSLNVCTG